MVSSTTFPTPPCPAARHFPADALLAFQTSASEDAFRVLVRHYYPMIFATALRRAEGNHGLAEDAAQLVLIALARKSRGLRPATLGAWLHRHTCFTTSKLLRTERRRSSREQMAAADSSSASLPHVAHSSAMDDLLLGLPETDRRILLLRHVDGQTHDEIARLLGLSPAAAKKRSERALHKLRVLLRGESSGEGRFGAWLLPPASIATAPMADAAATKALAAPSTSILTTWLSHPISGASLGSAAAIALFAVPLAGVWEAPLANPVSAHPEASATAATPWKAIPGALPDYRGPASPAEAVVRLLEIARTRGLEGDGRDRARAIADELPAAWRHEVMLGLAAQAPAGLASTSWFEETLQALAERWCPTQVPADLRELLPIVRDRNSRRSLAKACADFNLPDTLAMAGDLPGDPVFAPTARQTAFLREDFQVGILTSIAASEDGKAALDYYLSLPQVLRPDGTTRMAQQELTARLRASPGLQRSVWKNLDRVPPEELPHVLMLLGSGQSEIPAIDIPPLARAYLDVGQVWQAIPHDNKSPLPMEDVLDAWEAAVPDDLRLPLAATFTPQHPPTLLALARRLGEASGGGEFDALRLNLIHCRSDSTKPIPPPDDLFAMAARIRDPDARFKARQILLRSCGGLDKAGPYFEKYIPGTERAIHRLLLVSENHDYPE